MILIEFINEYKIWYLIIGFITSIFSIGQFNFPLFIYIWPYCFLSYLHKMNSKLIPLLIVNSRSISPRREMNTIFVSLETCVFSSRL